MIFSLLDRDLAGEFFRALGVLMALLAILLLADTLVGNLSEMVGENTVVHWLFLYYILRLPSFFMEVAALAVGATILWVATRKARTNEMLAWMAGGVSPRRVARPLVVISSLLAITCVAGNELFAQQARRQAEQIEESLIEGKDVTRSNNIYQRGSEDRIYIIESFDSAADEMIEPTVIELYPDTRAPRKIVRSARAEPSDLGEHRWVFVDATVRKFDEAGQLEEFTQPKAYDVELEPKLSAFLGRLDDPDNMSAMELHSYIKLIDAQGKETSQLRLRMHEKLSVLAGIAVIGLLMCAHAISPKAVGAIAGFGGGLAWIAAWYGVTVVFQKIGRADVGIPEALVAWAPNVIFGLIGIALMWKR